MTTHQEEALEFTGERFMPEVAGQIAFEHLHRYHFALRLVSGMQVLDVACGEGYGSDILARQARSVVGVDIAPQAVAHASTRYARGNLTFVEASAASLPFADRTFDAVVSFETIEHHDQHEEMMSEIRRVLKPAGLLIISSPNKQHYSIEPGYQNPFHVKELFREEFVSLVGQYFKHTALFGQRVVHGSLLIRSDEARSGDALETLCLDQQTLTVHPDLARPHYDLLVASDLELPAVANSLFEATVHGMDPAGFYGIHLPERVNTADTRINRLEIDLDSARAQILSGDKVVSRFDGLNSKLDHLLAAHEMESKLYSDIQRLSADLESVGVSNSALERAVKGLQAQLTSTNELLAQDEMELSELRTRLASRENQLQEVYNSFSWRSTAWVRAISRQLGRSR